VAGNVSSKLLTRHGIFHVPVYEALLHAEGTFARPDFAALEIDESDVLWDKAAVLIKASQPKGLREGINVNWNGVVSAVSPLTGTSDLLGTNLSAPVPMSGSKDRTEFAFQFSIKAAGSQDLEFLPLGNDTHVHLESDWPHPNFSGDYLPTDRTVTEKGFSADWQVSGLGRNLPQQFKRSELRTEALSVPSFQTAFMKPVDVYQLSDRAAKYSVLFIFLTFLGFFLFEILGRLKVHPVQYLLVGFALCLFYLLLLSLSEHIPFAASYGTAAAATVALITAYMSRLLKFRKTLLLSSVLSGLYAYLYNLLRAEDGSLLMGSIGLFAILALVMFLTRKIDWYSVNAGTTVTPETAS
jgi:inner membrane protein